MRGTVTEQALLAAGERLTEAAGPREGAVEDLATDDLAAMREQGDLPAFMRLRIRPVRSAVRVVALWQRLSGPAGHKPGAWPSALPLGACFRRDRGGEPELCDCARCLALATSCEDSNSCRCPRRGTVRAPVMRGSHRASPGTDGLAATASPPTDRGAR